MSYGLSVLVSDIPANKEIGLPFERYFRCGDVFDLRCKLEGLLEKGFSHREQQDLRNKVQEIYNWDAIAEQIIEVYNSNVK